MTLRMQIIALTTGITAVVLVIFAVPLALVMRQTVTDRSVSELQSITQGVADYLSTNGRTAAQSKAYVDRVNTRSESVIFVLLPDGTSIGQQLPDSVPPPGIKPPGDGDSDRDDRDLGKVSDARVQRIGDGWVVTIASSSASGRALVRGYESDDEANAQVYSRWALIGGGAVVLVLVAAGGAELLSRRLIRPLVATAATAGALARGDLDARAPLAGAPEVSEVASALNILADRIEQLLASERETVADFSHRLRTPLTAIRLDAEALGDSDRSQDLIRHVAILDTTLTALIRHARTPERERGDRRCDAHAVVEDRFDFWSPLAEDQGRSFTLDSSGDRAWWVGCREDDLAAAIDALLENAIAHTPEGTTVQVQLRSLDDGVMIAVLDHGSGIPAGAGMRGRSDRGSTGLGLDIARSCAESTGGHLQVERADGITTVRLVLQAPHSEC